MPREGLGMRLTSDEIIANTSLPLRLLSLLSFVVLHSEVSHGQDSIANAERRKLEVREWFLELSPHSSAHAMRGIASCFHTIDAGK